MGGTTPDPQPGPDGLAPEVTLTSIAGDETVSLRLFPGENGDLFLGTFDGDDNTVLTVQAGNGNDITSNRCLDIFTAVSMHLQHTTNTLAIVFN